MKLEILEYSQPYRDCIILQRAHTLSIYRHTVICIYTYVVNQEHPTTNYSTLNSQENTALESQPMPGRHGTWRSSKDAYSCSQGKSLSLPAKGQDLVLNISRQRKASANSVGALRLCLRASRIGDSPHRRCGQRIHCIHGEVDVPQLCRVDQEVDAVSSLNAEGCNILLGRLPLLRRSCSFTSSS